jgi:hypothetical protein
MQRMGNLLPSLLTSKGVKLAGYGFFDSCHNVLAAFLSVIYFYGLQLIHWSYGTCDWLAGRMFDWFSPQHRHLQKLYANHR